MPSAAFAQNSFGTRSLILHTMARAGWADVSEEADDCWQFQHEEKGCAAAAPHPTWNSKARPSGLQPEALQSQGSVARPWQASGWLLDLEVYHYICAVMRPDAHLRWGRLSAWQRDLQKRSAGWDFPCPFWHALLYDLDLGLHVEVEAFVRLLTAEGCNLVMMDAWQQHLRLVTRRLWFPRRLWYDLVHNVNLRAGEPWVRLSLAGMLSKHAHLQY